MQAINVLNKYSSSFAKPPVITANFITYNINYNITSELSFIPLSDTLNNNQSLWELYKDGINNKILCPQLHGYCHYDEAKLLQFYILGFRNSGFVNTFLFFRRKN